MKTTSITARLNYRADSEGCHAHIIQVIHRRRRSILTTPYRLRPEEFDAQRGRAVAVNRRLVHFVVFESDTKHLNMFYVKYILKRG